MSNNQRPAPRFSVGTLVEIRNVISTQYSGQTGTVVLVRPSPRNRTLDKYVVRFASGVEKEFWDIQLTELPKSELDQPTAIGNETHTPTHGSN
jgi:hypothetical protein